MLDTGAFPLARTPKAVAHSATVTYSDDGATVDPGTVTVTVTREDGTALYTGAATTGTGAAARAYALTASDTAALDVLTLTWVSATRGTLTTYVEVVGGFLFTIAEARNTPPLSNTTTYTTAEILTARVLAETALEDVCHVAFVPRYFRKRYDGSGGDDIVVMPRPLTVTSASVGDTALTAGELADLELYEDGRIYHASKWTAGRRNVTVKGTHGYPYPPPRAGLAALKLAKFWLVDTPIDERATSVQNDGGTVQIFGGSTRLQEAVFAIPEARVCVDLYGLA